MVIYPTMTSDTADPTPTPEPADLSPSPRQAEIETGAWLDIVSACAALTCTERTIQRRVARGEIQRRTLAGGRAEFWIAGAEPVTLSPSPRQDGPQNERSVALAVVDEYRALVDRIAEQAEEIGRLRAELEAARPTLTPPAPDTRPWWRRWFGA